MIDYIQEVLGDKCKGWSACVTLEQSDAAPWGQISWSGEWLPSMWAHPVDQMEKYFWSLLTNTLIRFKKYCWRNIKGDRTVWHLGWWGDQQNTTFLCAEIWRYFEVIVHIFFSMNSKRYPVLTNVGNSVGRGKKWNKITFSTIRQCGFENSLMSRSDKQSWPIMRNRVDQSTHQLPSSHLAIWPTQALSMIKHKTCTTLC